MVNQKLNAICFDEKSLRNMSDAGKAFRNVLFWLTSYKPSFPNTVRKAPSASIVCGLCRTSDQTVSPAEMFFSEVDATDDLFDGMLDAIVLKLWTAIS